MKFVALAACAVLLAVCATPLQADVVYTLNSPSITLHPGQTVTLWATVLNTNEYDVSFYGMSIGYSPDTPGDAGLPFMLTLHPNQSYTWGAFTMTALSTAKLGNYAGSTHMDWCDTATRKIVFYRGADYHLTVVPEPAGCLPLALGLLGTMRFVRRHAPLLCPSSPGVRQRHVSRSAR